MKQHCEAFPPTPVSVYLAVALGHSSTLMPANWVKLWPLCLL